MQGAVVAPLIVVDFRSVASTFAPGVPRVALAAGFPIESGLVPI